MEAKDTVMGRKQLWGYVDVDHMVSAQAEISFKAGIEEVVEWINLNRIGGYNICIKVGFEEWQAKLKEWEME